MKRIIYKYQLKDLGITEVKTTGATKVLKFAFKDGQPVVWMECHPDNKQERVISFLLIFTGQEFGYKSGWEYLDTVIEGSLVYHCYWKRGNV